MNNHQALIEDRWNTVYVQQDIKHCTGKPKKAAHLFFIITAVSPAEPEMHHGIL